MAQPRMLTTKEAAEAIGISQQTLQRYVKQEKVRPTLRLPSGQMRWDLDALKRQLQFVEEDE
jgi:predicted site-specific integrase-resolvase